MNMDNVTTFETGLELKTRGFPQPDFQIGQIWWIYTLSGQKSITITQVSGTCVNACANNGDEYDESDIAEYACVYMPTPADIMAELTPDYFLMRDFPVKGVIYWQCKSEAKNYQTEKHETPAEACALAFMDN